MLHEPIELTLLDNRTTPFIGLAFLASYSWPTVSSRSDIAPLLWVSSAPLPETLTIPEKADVRERTEEGGRVVALDERDRLVVSEGVVFVLMLGAFRSSIMSADQVFMSRIPPAWRLR